MLVYQRVSHKFDHSMPIFYPNFQNGIPGTGQGLTGTCHQGKPTKGLPSRRRELLEMVDEIWGVAIHGGLMVDL